MVGTVIGAVAGPVIGGLMGGGQQQGSTTSTQASFPKWLSPMLQDQFSALIPQINSLSSQTYQPYGGQQVAGFTPDQLQAFGINQGMVGQAQQGLSQGAGILNNVSNQGLNGINPNLIQSYMNPYTQNVVNANTQQALQGYNLQKQQLQEQQGQTGAFGGSRSAIASGQLNKNFFNNLNAQNAGLYSQGYGQALGAAQTGLKLSDIAGTQIGQNALQTQQAGMAQAGALGQQGMLQQQLSQQQLNVPYQNYLAAQEFPYQQQQYDLSGLGSIANIYKGGISSQTNTGGPGPWGNALGSLAMSAGMNGQSSPFGSLGQTQNYSDGTSINWNGTGIAGGLQSFGNGLSSFFGFRQGGQVPFHKTGDGQHEYGSYASGGLVDPYGSGEAHTPYSGVLPVQEHSSGPYDLSGIGPYGSTASRNLSSPGVRVGRSVRSNYAQKAPKVPLMPMMGLGRGYALGGLVDGFHDQMMNHFQCGGLIPHGMYADGGQVDQGFFDTAQSQLEDLPHEMGQGLDWFAHNMTPYYNKDGSMAHLGDTAFGKGYKASEKPSAYALMLQPELAAGAGLAFKGAEGAATGVEALIAAAKNNPQLVSKLARYAGLYSMSKDDIDSSVSKMKANMPQSKTPNYDAAHPDIQAQVNSIVNPDQQQGDPMAAHDAAMVAKVGDKANTGPMYGNGPSPMGAIPQSLGEPSIADKAKAIALGNGSGKQYFAPQARDTNEFTDYVDPKNITETSAPSKGLFGQQTNPDQGQVNLPLVQFGAALLGSRGNFFQSMGAAGQAYAAQKNAEAINAQRNALLEQLQGTRQEKADAYAEQVAKTGMGNPLNQAYKMAQIEHLQQQSGNPYAQAYSKAYNTLMQNTPAAGMDPQVQAQVQQTAALIAQQAMGGGMQQQAQPNASEQALQWEMLPK